MEGNVVSKFFSTLKNKLNTNNKDNSQGLDCAFSFEELNDLTKQNNEKIKELKKNSLYKEDKKEIISNKDKVVQVLENNLILDKEENAILNSKEEQTEELEQVEEEVVHSKIDENKNLNSYINLTEERQNVISDSWQKIDVIKLDENILKGKDILAHNYTITYADDALRYIYMIRGEYDVLIEYFIGFNNEKKGIFNQTIFSDKLENEWKYLANYIKLLEKIRGVKR